MNIEFMIFEGHEVEVIDLNGQILFNPKHVAECLDIADVKSSIRNFSEKQLVKVKNSDVHNMHFRKLNNAGENFLTESGVYKLVFKSRKPNAEKFTDWVTDEVLPSIRKHGIYATPTTIEQMLNNPDTMITFLQELKLEREQRQQLQMENASLLPDASLARDVIQHSDCFSLKEVADMIEIGRTTLCSLLLTGNVFSKQTGYNLPLNKYIKKGYFKVKLHEKYYVPVTFVTPKGLIFIYRLIKKFNMLDDFNTDVLVQSSNMEVTL